MMGGDEVAPPMPGGSAALEGKQQLPAFFMTGEVMGGGTIGERLDAALDAGCDDSAGSSDTSGALFAATAPSLPPARIGGGGGGGGGDGGGEKR